MPCGSCNSGCSSCPRRPKHNDCDGASCAAVAIGAVAAGALAYYGATVRPWTAPPDITGIYRIEDYREVSEDVEGALVQTCAKVVDPATLKVLVTNYSLQDPCKAGLKVSIVDGQGTTVVEQLGIWTYVPLIGWELRLTYRTVEDRFVTVLGRGRIRLGYRIAGVGQVVRLFWFLQSTKGDGSILERSAELYRIADAPPQ